MISSKYITEDPKKSKISPTQKSVIIKNEGLRLFARVLIPALDSENEKRPAVLFVHGFPGGEKLWDLVIGLRRCGFVSVAAGLRGCWGSEGYYRFSTLTSDVRANLDYMITHADELHIDTNSIYLIGHSMGGFTVLRMMAEGGPFKGSVVLAPCNLLHYSAQKYFGQDAAEYLSLEAGGVSTLERGRQILLEDVASHKNQFDFKYLASKADLKKPMYFIGAAHDLACPIETDLNVYLDALRERGYNPDSLILDTDHSFQDTRIGFLKSVAGWLEQIEKD